MRNFGALTGLSTSDFQSEVGEVFGAIGGELPAKSGRRFSSFFCRGKSSEAFSTAKLHRKFHHQTSLRGSGLWRALHWRVPNPPGANPLVAERAFPTSDYWGRTGVARCA